MSGPNTHNARLEFSVDQATLIANTALELVAPMDGYIKEADFIVQTAITTGGTLTWRNWRTGSAVTVDSLSATFPNGATKGSKPTVKADSKKGHASRYVKKGDRIQLQPTSFATAGAVWGYVVIEAMDQGGANPV